MSGPGALREGSDVLTFPHSIGPDVRLRFSDKPDARIRGVLKANGFRWSPAAGEWWRRRVSSAADFLAALDRLVDPGKPDGLRWDQRVRWRIFVDAGAA